MRKCLILLFAFTVTSASGAPAWTWVDANGQVHYADQPVPGAKQIELSAAQSGGPRRQQQAEEATARTAAPEKSAGAVARYQKFDIVSPKQQETLWNVGTVVNVGVEIDPPLQATHRLDLSVDGERRNLNTTSTELILNDVFRGVHVIQALVVDQSGTEVLRSVPTTFMVQQTSVQNPQADSPTKPARPQPKRP
jgi:hypothetical protein